MIESIDSKLISVCIIIDYALITDLYIFVYGSAECATIILKCSKVKLLISNNFDWFYSEICNISEWICVNYPIRDRIVFTQIGQVVAAYLPPPPPYITPPVKLKKQLL